MSFLPYGRQSIDDSDITAVVAALKSDYLTTGPLVGEFEQALAETVGAREAVVVANGTAALHLAVLTEELTPKCVVVVPAVTFTASANCVAYCGAQVVFADVDPFTGLITDDSFNAALEVIARDYHGYRFAGVIPVHLAGRPVDLTHMSGVCGEHGAFLLEDACHAIGGSGPQGKIGSCAHSDMACFSFHPVKTLTTGEGGAVTTKDPVLAHRLRLLRSHGIERDPAHRVGLRYDAPGDAADADDGAWVYEQHCLGFNYRLPDLNCALGLSQLKRLPQFADKRARLVTAYQQALAGGNIPVTWTPPALGTDPVFHLFQLTIDFRAIGTTRTKVMQGLRERGIGSQVHYIPVHRQPYWQTHTLAQRPLPNADQFYQSTLSLPLYADMDDDAPYRVIQALQEVL